MKKILLLLSTWLGISAALAKTNGNSLPLSSAPSHAETIQDEISTTISYLVLWHKDGTKVLFDLAEEPKICYAAEKVSIESTTRVEYEFNAIRKMTYELDVENDIRMLKIQNKRPFKTVGDHITFLPSDKDLRVRIVSLSGMVLKDFVVQKNDTSTIDLHSLGSKVYLINVNGVTYKIYTR